MEGESAEEGENEDASSTSQGNGDDNGPSEEEGEALEGEGSGEGEGKDVGSASQGNGDDDRSDKQPYYKYEDYTDAIGRIRTHLTTFLGDSALSEIVAVLDSFKDKIADPVDGDSPCSILNFIATALLEREDSEGAEMAMREGIETRREGDNFFCYSSLAALMAARGDVAGAETCF
jgi:hypothetical protein